MFSFSFNRIKKLSKYLFCPLYRHNPILIETRDFQ